MTDQHTDTLTDADLDRIEADGGGFADIAKLAAEVRRLQRELGWYADESNWQNFEGTGYLIANDYIALLEERELLKDFLGEVHGSIGAFVFRSGDRPEIRKAASAAFFDEVWDAYKRVKTALEPEPQP